MPIDSADIERARRTDLAEYLRRQGETLRRSGSEWEWRHEGAKVTIRGTLWFHQYDRQGGDAMSCAVVWRQDVCGGCAGAVGAGGNTAIRNGAAIA